MVLPTSKVHPLCEYSLDKPRAVLPVLGAAVLPMLGAAMLLRLGAALLPQVGGESLRSACVTMSAAMTCFSLSLLHKVFNLKFKLALYCYIDHTLVSFQSIAKSKVINIYICVLF